MNEYDEKWEDQINALLAGELSDTDAEALKSEATDDRDLARAIIEAHQLQRAMDAVQVERAPASLSKRLKAIPRKQRADSRVGIRFFEPRWVMALAAVPLAIITINLMQPGTPSDTDIAKARQDLAIAFAYIDRAGSITGREIESTVGNTMADALNGSVNKTINLQNENSKEKEV
jgi:hypothetical protein